MDSGNNVLQFRRDESGTEETEKEKSNEFELVTRANEAKKQRLIEERRIHNANVTRSYKLSPRK